MDYTDLLDDYETDYSTLEQDAGYILSDNLQDRSVRSGLSLAGWKPGKDPQAQTAEWWEFDWEYASTPEQTSQEFAIVNYNTTFYQYSDENITCLIHEASMPSSKEKLLHFLERTIPDCFSILS